MSGFAADLRPESHEAPLMEYDASKWSEDEAIVRIGDEFLQCVFYLYPSIPDAESGKALGGTGFIVSVPSKTVNGGSFFYGVTNRHVIEGGSSTVRLNKADGTVAFADTPENLWTYSPYGDDLAVLVMGFDDVRHFQVRAVPIDLFVTAEIMQERDIGPGDHVFMPGRFVNHEGRQRNIPSVRFGNIAQMPWEPIRHRAGFKLIEQESFLVDARSIPGYSGSPVFVYIPAWSPRPGTKTIEAMPVGPWLLGVDWAHINDYMPAVNEQGNEMPFKVRANSGMMAVVPAWKLRDLLDMPKLRHWREEDEERAMQSAPPAPVTKTSVECVDEEAFNKTLKQMLSTPPNPRGGGAKGE